MKPLAEGYRFPSFSLAKNPLEALSGMNQILSYVTDYSLGHPLIRFVSSYLQGS